MSRSRIFAAFAVLVAALAVTSSALAATAPTLASPSAASLAKGYPSYAWTNGPGGEFVSYIVVSETNKLGAFGALTNQHGSASIGGLTAGQTSVTSTYLHKAGTWFYQAKWIDPLATSAQNYTAVSSFVVKPYIKGLKITTITQQASSTYFAASMRVTTNAKTRLTCTVTKGSKKIGSITQDFNSPTVGRPSTIGCFRIAVPEKYDGDVLTVSVKLQAGKAVARASKNFTAR